VAALETIATDLARAGGAYEQRRTLDLASATRSS
jgi:hypothetical protein